MARHIHMTVFSGNLIGTMADVDEDASARRYMELLRARLRQVYSDAEADIRLLGSSFCNAGPRWGRWASGQDYLPDNSALVTCDRYAELAGRERARKQRIQIAKMARGKGVEAFALVTPQQLAENPDKILRTWQYADDAERRDLGEPDQRVEMTVARPSPVRTAEPRTPGVRVHADRRRRGLRALRAQ
ncbi:MAG TPA: hypothetical protein VKF37_20985 [Chloroflexota bacterium]|nr:hypothetical protein [Chloroflexota bacterium]